MNAVVGALRAVIVPARIALWLLAATLGAGIAMAQTEAPKPAVKTPKKTKEKQPQAPAEQPQQAQPQPAQPQQPAAAPALPPLIYSPWTKICPKPNAPQQQTKTICLTVKEARLETGQFVVGAALIDQQGEEKKLLRVTLPLGMQLAPGTRLALDSDQPATAVYVTCIPNGCMADFDINSNFVGRMKKGQQLVLQGVNMTGQIATFTIPLAEFGKAVDGPPTDPEEFGRQQQAEWEKRLKGRTPPAPPAAPK